MRQIRLPILALAVVAMASPAFADATLFVGSMPTPSNRPARGAALGVGLVILGFEFEYASSSEDEAAATPALTTVMGNVLLQPPVAIAGVQPYLTAGVGGFRERLDVRQETHIGVNTGLGVKIALAGPLRVRLDYRLMHLRGDPLYATVHRVYAGANLGF